MTWETHNSPICFLKSRLTKLCIALYGYLILLEGLTSFHPQPQLSQLFYIHNRGKIDLIVVLHYHNPDQTVCHTKPVPERRCKYISANLYVIQINKKPFFHHNSFQVATTILTILKLNLKILNLKNIHNFNRYTRKPLVSF